MTPERNLENALIALATSAMDGSGRKVNLSPITITAEAIREVLARHMKNYPGNDGVFMGQFGEQAFLHNAKLLINALDMALIHEGGSKLNQEWPGS